MVTQWVTKLASATGGDMWAHRREEKKKVKWEDVGGKISANMWERQGEKTKLPPRVHSYFVQHAHEMLGHFDFCLPFQIICSITLKKLQKIF